MSKKFLDADSENPFDAGMSIEEADRALYGGVDIPDSGRIVAKPISIMEIRPDRAQPRRVIPMVVRGEWDGAPESIPDLLDQWYLGAVHQYGKSFNVADVLRGQRALELTDDAGSVLVGFNKLMNLAASIQNEGLTNPITVVRSAGGYMIETGERRYLAHHLLNHYLEYGKWDRIPAREVEYDLFRQASENNARDSLNAIQMARQIALLIMAERGHIDGHDYDTFEDMVLPGENDRKFYAQVANGNIHRIPAGSGEKISHAVGLSMARISQYRRLLKVTDDDELNDKIWLEADTNDWSENYIREYVQSLTTVKHEEADETLTGVKVDRGQSGAIPGERERFGRFGEPAGRLPESSAYAPPPPSAPAVERHKSPEISANEPRQSVVPPALSGSEGYIPEVDRHEADDSGLGNVLYSEQLVKKLDMMGIVAQLSHMAGILGHGKCQDDMRELLKLSTVDVENMASEMSKDAFVEYLTPITERVGLMLEETYGKFIDFAQAWDELDEDVRRNS